MEEKLKKLEKTFFVSTFLMGFLLLVIFAIVKYPKWWIWIEEDDSPNAIFQLLMLYSSFAVGFGISIIHFLNEKIDKKEKTIWEMASFGMLLLTLETKYEVHNQVRRVLEVKKDFPIFLWFERGDFMLTLILICCLIFAFFFIKYLKQNKKAFLWFSIATIVSIWSVAIDSYHLNHIINVSEMTENSIEEISETIACLFFLNSYFSMLCFYLKNFLNDKKNEIL